MTNQLDLFHVETQPVTEIAKPPRRATVYPDGEQLVCFEVVEPDNTPKTQAAHYMTLWDTDGLPIVKLVDNWYPYRSGNKQARTKSYSKVKQRFDQIIETGLIGWSEIKSTETSMAEHQWGDSQLTCKRYPDSTIHLSE